jgi:ABC-type cobalamin/Fe3+-siderophores transport system ATPase subunit
LIIVYAYGENNIINFTHFNNKSVIINAPNGFGKSALYEIICYAIYGETMPSRISKKYTQLLSLILNQLKLLHLLHLLLIM